MAPDLFEVFLFVFGLSDFENGLTPLIQILVILGHVACLPGFVVLFLKTANANWATKLSVYYRFFLIIESLIVYLWRITHKCQRLAARRKSSSWSYVILVLLDILASVAVVMYLATFDSVNWHFPMSEVVGILVLVSRVGSIVINIQSVVLNLGMARIISETAHRIGKRAAPNSSTTIDAACRLLEAECAYLTRKLWLPFTMMHILCFGVLATAVPLHTGKTPCTENIIYATYEDSQFMIQFLVMVSAADSLTKNSGKILRRIRADKEHFRPPIRRSVVFARSRYGLWIALGTLLSWKSWCSFLGLIWGFTLTAFQMTLMTSVDSAICEW